jgi:hypothetical protein
MKETTTTSREKLMGLLEKKYPNMFLRTTEEFNGNKGGIWTSGEESPSCKDGLEMFDYWTENHTKYNLGVHKEIYDYLEKHGWYCQWYDCGTMMIYEI